MKDQTFNLLFWHESLRLHPASIATMAQFTLAIVILAYFLSLRGKTRDTWLMIIYMSFAMLVYLVDIGVTSSKPPLYSYFRISHTILLAAWTLFWTWFAYVYRSNSLRAEAISVTVFEALLLIVVLALPSFNYFNFPTYRFFILLQGWTIVVLFRRSANASMQSDNYSRTILDHLVKPNGRNALALRAFAILFSCWLAFLIVTFTIGSAFTYHIGQFVLLLGVLVVHVNHASEITTFQVKLVALPMATILTLLGILPFLIYGTSPPEAAWENINVVEQRQLAVFAWLIPLSTAFVIVAFIIFYHFGLLRPLGFLLRGVRRIEEGKFDSPVPILSQDEIGSLAQSLNNMAKSLKESHKELEIRVAERTAELQASLVRLKATQAQLIQSEKMASLGELTAGIAHEIQNPLNFVNNFSEINKEMIADLKDELHKGNFDEVKIIAGDLEVNEEKIAYHGKRADAIVKGMLQHSRKATGTKESTDINALCDEFLHLSYHGLRAKNKSFNATYKTDFDNSIDKINIVPQDIGRVLLNLFNNAFYAVNEKAKTVGGSYEPTVWISTKKAAGQAEVMIRDNGTGIPQGISDKIFQPFFTTKATGQGTGLGLSIAYDIVKAHGGQIAVESSEGEGTNFFITLPA